MLLDANQSAWPAIEIDFGSVSRINRMLRFDPESLELPCGPQGKPLTDLHHVSVQEWLLTWIGAPVAVGFALLESEIAARKLTWDSFAALWKGEAVERLREAIWKAWVDYLPPGPRQLSEQLARNIEHQRGLSLEKLPEASALLMRAREQETEAHLAKARAKVGASGNSTAGDGPASSDSTPGPSPTENSN